MLYMMNFFRKKQIYLDFASATPIDRSVFKEIKRNEKIFFTNAGSIHKLGLLSDSLLEKSREKISKIINAHSNEIIFTGSGTESDALAILGMVYEFRKNNKTTIPHIITTSIEHSAILENCKFLKNNNLAEITYINPNINGVINPKDIKEAIKSNTILVSVMYVNNEIGTIQPIQEIAKEIRHYRKNNSSSQFPLFHTDACQAINYLFISNIEKIGVDLMSFNSSKIYGPKGVGVLYKKRNVTISPIYKGGDQEFGLRPGTENVVGIAGFAKALEITEKLKNKEVIRLTEIRNYGINKILELKEKTGFDIILNGSLEERLPNNINISILNFSSELLVLELDAKGIYVSEKSACHSKGNEDSHVIRVLRNMDNSIIDLKENFGSVRISLGRTTTKGNIDYLISSLEKILMKYKPFK